MWNLDQIIEQNNTAALDYMMRGVAVEEAQAPQPEAWALSLLAEMLQVGPPLLSAIVSCLNQVESEKDFLSLVMMLLPEHEREIMSAPKNRRVYNFCYYFGRKYYPLPANTDCSTTDWVDGMPVALMAMSYSSYHNLQMRPGFILLLSLVIYPYEGDVRDLEDDSVPFNPALWGSDKYKPSAEDRNWVRRLVANLAIGGEWIAPMGFKVVKIAENEIELRQAVDNDTVKETISRTLLIAERIGIKAKFSTAGRTAEEKIEGARVPLLDAVQNLVGPGLAGRVPGNGWTPEELHQMTDKTPYDGVGDFADWVCSQTGCVILDASYEGCEYLDGSSGPTFKWTRGNVDRLTEEWPKVREIRRKIDHLVQWLEANQSNHFQELLQFLLDNHLPKKRKAREFDPMEHLCELDQDYGEEEVPDNDYDNTD